MVCFCVLVDDYNLSFTGSPCYNDGCYNYNSIQPYYIVIHYSPIFKITGLTDFKQEIMGTFIAHLNIHVYHRPEKHSCS